MSDEITRGEFLRGFFKRGADEVKLGAKIDALNKKPKPPWAVTDFNEKCDRCGDCATACPTGVISLYPKETGDMAGVPYLNFLSSMCDFCGDCAIACKPNAINRETGKKNLGLAVANNACLVTKNVICDVCLDYCQERAITIAPGVIKIDAGKCTGCGSCVAPCPTRALEVKPLKVA
ncbi:hypothetical protein MNBD_NITROSPINAE01-1187 [hydrothermal vent metagenome]|uniref:4Fe-4S ferredoxin-type domain-containing protein n=1 Tax=hydrothermal vent metagenome TaxID=652676 RepID=A0A3B1CVQ8_9ZZZZ